MELKLNVYSVEYDEELGKKCLEESDWTNKVTDGIGEPIGEQVEEEK